VSASTTLVRLERIFLHSCHVRTYIMQHARTAVQIEFPQNAFIAAPVAAKVMLEACLLAAFATPCPPVSPKTSQLNPDITHSLDFNLTHLDCAASHCWQSMAVKK